MEETNTNNLTNNEPQDTPLEQEEGITENKTAEISMSDNLIEKRKEKLKQVFKKKGLWVILIFIAIFILGIYIRTLPMQDHGGSPGLWDITTNTWTLGPDLDPWLFQRYAKLIIEEGGLPAIDMMRNVPIGFDTTGELQMVSYMIVITHHIVNIFGNFDITFSAVFMPVFLFALTMITFFLFVREIFIRKSNKEKIKANLIALISTLFLVVIPSFLARTIAGIPEKESVAFFFMFLAFYLFLKAWKSKKLSNAIIFGILAGIITGLMNLTWGGVIYIYVGIGVSGIIAFVLNKFDNKKKLVFILWLLISPTLPALFSTRYSLFSFFTGIDTGIAFFVFILLIIDSLIWNTALSKLKIFRKTKLPKNITSILVVIIIAVIGVLIVNPSLLIDKIRVINQTMFRPVIGRWSMTVAENRQPYFVEWGSNFGPYIKSTPILFWLFFIGSVVLFWKMLKKLKKKDAGILTGLYILFFIGLVFSRYSPASTLNGENAISKFFYLGTLILFAISIIYFYIKYYREKNPGFEKIRYEYILLFTLFILTLFTARSAVRLIMVLATIAPIFVSFLIVESIDKFRGIKDETWKIIVGAFIILIIILSIFSGWTFYKAVSAQAYGFVPSSYNQQWQKAMDWVRDETPEDAVFSHWWDYGYWVQSIGERATSVDGGNAVVYWNYLMGRLVLTGDNQRDALEFLYNHNTTHLLIDSTDIGKYTAFSSIGSNEEFDRYSWISTFLLDEKQTQETKNQTLLIYPGGSALDEDLIIQSEGREVLLPGQRAGVGAIIIPMTNLGNKTEFAQPYAIMIYQGKQHKVSLRYLYVNGAMIDFRTGIEACAYTFPRIDQQGQGISSNPIGALLFLSPRLMRGMLANIYILGDPLERYPNLKLAYTQSNFVVESLRSQGMEISEFVYFQGTQGPIKIWEIEYTGNEEIKQEYLDTDPTKYLSWVL